MQRKVSVKTIILLIAIVMVLVFCISYIVVHIQSDKKTEALMESIGSTSSKVQETLAYENNTKVTVRTNTVQDQWNDKEFNSVDFSTVSEYENVVGWIKYAAGGIDYPVVQCEDNSKYLTTSIDGSYNINGWIYADYRADMENMTSQNTVIYGHDMLSGSMFGQLKNVQAEGFYDTEENNYIYYNTPKGRYIYKVIATYVTDTNFNFIQTVFTNEEFSQYVQTIREKTISQGVVIEDRVIYPTDKILTLCTCAEGGAKRLVVSAVLYKSEIL